MLVNVDMLTEGFDDPKINSVVLARLTLSTNRFWQMIGRGTRGPAVYGTHDCIVIDPVKLVRLYDYFNGYQPSFAKGGAVVAAEEDDETEPGEGALDPEVAAISLPPDPGRVAYQIDPDLERVHAQVAIALRHFLDGGGVSESAALEAARTVKVDVVESPPVFRATDAGFQTDTAAALLLREIADLERRAQVDLEWFRRQLPPSFDENLLAHRLRALRAVEALSLWTEAAFATAQMNGAFLDLMRKEAQATAALVHPVSEAAIGFQLHPAEAAVVDTALAMSAPDRKLLPAEVTVVVETLRRMFGRAPGDELVALLESRSSTAVPFESSGGGAGLRPAPASTAPARRARGCRRDRDGRRTPNLGGAGESHIDSCRRCRCCAWRPPRAERRAGIRSPDASLSVLLVLHTKRLTVLPILRHATGHVDMAHDRTADGGPDLLRPEQNPAVGDLGPVYKNGNSFRARAEARQREYRAQRLRVGWGRYGHLLTEEAAAAGANFLHPEAFQAARKRQTAGKGVAERTFENMLSSQAMCFNIFAPLSSRPDWQPASCGVSYPGSPRSRRSTSSTPRTGRSSTTRPGAAVWTATC